MEWGEGGERKKLALAVVPGLPQPSYTTGQWYSAFSLQVEFIPQGHVIQPMGIPKFGTVGALIAAVSRAIAINPATAVPLSNFWPCGKQRGTDDMACALVHRFGSQPDLVCGVGLLC